MVTTAPASPEETLTARQQAVLAAALQVLVAQGDRLTMTAVARQARCSKESLYKWFGDRDGLLIATVQFQASKVRAPRIDRERLDAVSLQEGLEGFARDLLTVLSGEISVALNRIGITHAGSLGRIVLENGRHAMGRRLKPVLEAGRAAGLLVLPDAEEAFRTYFGLVVRDVQIRLLLGEALNMPPHTIARDAERAVDQFLALYGAESNGRDSRPNH